MHTILAAIKDFAASAHSSQKRKYSDEPYINHPVRVMETCRQYTLDISISAAALLHDVLEDTQVTESELRNMLSGLMEPEQAIRTMRMVIELTDQFTKANYPRLNRTERKALEIDRLKMISPEGQTIKYADLIDNAVNIIHHDPSFGKVFLKEGRTLLSEMNKGNVHLYHRALKIIDEGLYPDEVQRDTTSSSLSSIC